MANLMNYLDWRGDLPMTVVPFCGVDALILAALSYVDYDGTGAEGSGVLLRDIPEIAAPADTGTETELYRQCRVLLAAAGRTERFGGMWIDRYVSELDREGGKQFSAIRALTPAGDTIVAFRGTDHTMVGWRENLHMSFESPVPAQAEAAAYLTDCCREARGRLIAVGHSKGGNLAVWAAAHLPAELQDKVAALYSFDGPGMDDRTAADEGYTGLLDRLHSIIPQGSVVGLLMNYHQNYTLVQSVNSGVKQHNPFSWQVTRDGFVEAQELTEYSRVARDTLHDWLYACTPEERENLVDTVFDAVEDAGVTTTGELGDEKFRTLRVLIENTARMDPDSRRGVLRDMGKLVRAGADRTWSALTDDPAEKLQNAYQSMMDKTEMPREMLQSAYQSVMDKTEAPREKLTELMMNTLSRLRKPQDKKDN